MSVEYFTGAQTAGFFAFRIFVDFNYLSEQKVALLFLVM